jgi:peptide/nickel transport system permease protein
VNLVAYVARRALFSFLVLLFVVVVTFVLSHSLGGDPIFAWLGKDALLHPNLVKLYTEKLHLDSPIYVQFFFYIVAVLSGNFGYSPIRGNVPVLSVLETTFPYTFQIMFFAYIFTLLIGITMGVVAARYHGTKIDNAVRAFYLGSVASPSFFIAIIFLLLFSYQLGIFPSSGAFSPTLLPPAVITGIPMLDSLLEGNWAYFASALDHVLLPSLTLAVVSFGIITRVLRSSMLDVMQANYIRTARAKGVRESNIFYGHGLRNALIPLVTLSTLMVVWLITGTVFVENIFSYPGLGQYLVQALTGLDYPGIMAVTILFAVIIVSANLAADILYAFADPEIRLG